MKVIEIDNIKKFRKVLLPNHINKKNFRFVNIKNNRSFRIKPFEKDGKTTTVMNGDEDVRIVYGLKPYYVLTNKRFNDGWSPVIKMDDRYKAINPYLNEEEPVYVVFKYDNDSFELIDSNARKEDAESYIDFLIKN